MSEATTSCTSHSSKKQAWSIATWSEVSWLSWTQSTASLLHAGLTPKLALQAFLLTLVSYTMINTWMLNRIDRVYRTAELDWLAKAPSDERVELVCEQVRAKRSLSSHTLLQSVFQTDIPASSQLLQLIEGIASDSDGVTARQTELQSAVTGDIRGMRWLTLSAQPVSGSELISRIERQDTTWKHKLASQKELAGDLREFLVGFSDLVIQEVRPSLRSLQRINGGIQWLTVFVTWLVLLAVAHRVVLLASLNARGWFVPRTTGARRGTIPFFAAMIQRRLKSPAKDSHRLSPTAATTDVLGDHETDEAVRGTIPPLYDGATQAVQFLENRHLPDLLDRQVYGPLSFLLGLLPSLGFIGTVYGMGDALLSADGLFQAADKGAAISRITTHLGFAFDTTLVALLAGIVASAVVVWLRVWENQLWHAAEQTRGN